MTGRPDTFRRPNGLPPGGRLWTVPGAILALAAWLPGCATAPVGLHAASLPPMVASAEEPIAPYMPVYRPRHTRRALGRLETRVRGAKEGLVLKALAPADHVGETVHPSPALHWYVSQPVASPLVFTLEDIRQLHPVLEVTLTPPIKPGIHEIRLADYGKALEPEVQYRWHLSIPTDARSRSRDIQAMGVIERVPYDQAIVEGRTACRDPRDVFCLYVQSGLWYDAVQVISDLIIASPHDRVLHLQRAALLEKVGLSDVAEYDRLQYGP